MKHAKPVQKYFRCIQKCVICMKKQASNHIVQQKLYLKYAKCVKQMFWLYKKNVRFIRTKQTRKHILGKF